MLRPDHDVFLTIAGDGDPDYVRGLKLFAAKTIRTVEGLLEGGRLGDVALVGDDVVALAAGPLVVHWLAAGRPPTRAKARTGTTTPACTPAFVIACSGNGGRS